MPQSCHSAVCKSFAKAAEALPVCSPSGQGRHPASNLTAWQRHLCRWSAGRTVGTPPRLWQRPAMRKQMIDRDFPVSDEPGTFRLPDRGKGPRADNRELLAQQVAADVERHAAALADKTYRSPWSRRAHRGHPALWRARCVQRQIGAGAMGESLDRLNRIGSLGIDQRIGAELLGARQPFSADVKRDHARAHGHGELRRRQPDRTLPDDRDGVRAAEIYPAQRAIGSASAAGNRCAGREA